jgi:hypothetical protein
MDSMTTKLEFARKGCESPSSHKLLNTTRSFFKITSTAVLAAGLAFVPMVFPKLVRAQDTATQAVTNGKKQLAPELSTLTKVSLADMQKLDSLTNEVRGGLAVEGGRFGIEAYVQYPNGSKGEYLVVRADICQAAGCHVSHDPSDSGVVVPDKLLAVEHETYDTTKVITYIDLKPLDQLYKKATGKELKFVKLVETRGIDADIGNYTGVYVIPVEKPDGEIKDGIPVFIVVCNAKKVYSDENVIAMR